MPRPSAQATPVCPQYSPAAPRQHGGTTSAGHYARKVKELQTENRGVSGSIPLRATTLIPLITMICGKAGEQGECGALAFPENHTVFILNDDADLLFERELPARATTDLAHYSFGGLLLLACHFETLLGVPGPGKCLLAQTA